MSAVAAPPLDALDTAALEAALSAALEAIAAEFRQVAFASSLGAEDMVLTEAIVRARVPVRVFTLDTGRLHAETLALIEAVRARYGLAIEVVRPQAEAVAAYVAAHGANAFYESVALRQRCCAIRKVEPLRRALTGADAWITGLRRAQSTTRTGLAAREHDAVHGIVKFNPLADWSEAQVWSVIRARSIPYNPLHDKGYPSIGCEPCTRAIRPGEDVRAGRWWWESTDSRECGLHVAPAGEYQETASP